MNDIIKRQLNDVDQLLQEAIQISLQPRHSIVFQQRLNNFHEHFQVNNNNFC